MWFHARSISRMATLYELDAPFTAARARSNRGLIYNQNGQLAATTAKKGLMRSLTKKKGSCFHDRDSEALFRLRPGIELRTDCSELGPRDRNRSAARDSLDPHLTFGSHGTPEAPARSTERWTPVARHRAGHNVGAGTCLYRNAALTGDRDAPVHLQSVGGKPATVGADGGTDPARSGTNDGLFRARPNWLLRPTSCHAALDAHAAAGRGLVQRYPQFRARATPEPAASRHSRTWR